MILNYNIDLSKYQLILCNPLKYSESFTFIPIKIYNKGLHKCIFQTPLLFTPFGIQKTHNDKNIIDLSFQNKKNDKSLCIFLNKLKSIYKTIYKKLNTKYEINSFIKETEFEECIRFKVSSSILIYDEYKNILNEINKFTYGNFIIHLDGLWLNNNSIWFQWYLLQAKIKIPLYLKEYSFIDEIENKEKIKNETNKYDKMIKMGVPKQAVERQKLLDGFIPIPPPPPLSLLNKSPIKKEIPKITANDLRSVTLKKGKTINKIDKIKKRNNFEPPTLEELQSTLSKLKSIK
jgi:hypothetical protein